MRLTHRSIGVQDGRLPPPGPGIRGAHPHDGLVIEVARIKVEQRNGSTIALLFPSEVQLNTVIRLLANVESVSANDTAILSGVGLSSLPIPGLPIDTIATGFFVSDRGVGSPT